ncbi:aldo/keto reductase [Serpentinicella sp. ANB-PHB4]|uniref:aldo/keto reductase n=1 Tax=Serpentinicella sp. ANB-PHB4 TaxID=3074076 RepID=UPI0028545D25|nr:aldo/keto reductase [Serpentinicella sp. ANB-PHB4]MDR5658583.1 aldo/keto reductase [Serpentinicella sp. ANB-PHB4]
MIYRQYGQTGKNVSVIGLGGMRFGEDEDYAVEIIKKAHELGINYFDTAPYYCGDRSEYIYGKAFEQIKDNFYTATKSGIFNEPTADDVRRRIDKSLKRLGIDKIDFYHMWCIMDLAQYDNVMAPNGPYEGALKAKNEGLIDHLVFSTHCKGEDIRKIIEDKVFEGVLLGYNVINHPFRQEGINAAIEQDMAVVTMNPLGGGLIPNSHEYFDFLKERDDETVSQAALRFNIAQPGVTVTLAGISTLEELYENVKTLDYPVTVSDEKKIEIQSKITKKMDTLCTTCGYCLKCPKKIKINRYLEAYNMTLLKDADEMKKHLTFLKTEGALKSESVGAKDCISCGKCEILCTQKIPIVKRLQEISEMNF